MIADNTYGRKMDTAAKDIILEQVKDKSKRCLSTIGSIVNAFFLISQIKSKIGQDSVLNFIL